MQSRLEGARRHTEGLGPVSVGQPEVVVDDERGPMLRFQVAEGTVDLVPVRQCTSRIRGPQQIRRGLVCEVDLASLVTRNTIGGADKDAADPRPESIGVPQRTQVSPGADERLLYCVLGLVTISEHQLSEVVELGDGCLREEGERLPVASLRALHQVPLHVYPLLAQAAVTRSVCHGSTSYNAADAKACRARQAVPTCTQTAAAKASDPEEAGHIALGGGDAHRHADSPKGLALHQSAGLSRRLVALSFATAAALAAQLVAVAPAAAAAPRCDGRIATIVGTSGDDTLKGTDGPDVIVGLGGFDTIRGRGGDDVICGNGPTYNGPGEGAPTGDNLYGGPGKDVLVGGPGDDFLYGGAGNDRLEGGTGYDYLVPGAGDDRVDGGPQLDTVAYDFAPRGVHIDLAFGIATGWGRDFLVSVERAVGSAFDDYIHGDDGPNDLVGNDGNDLIDGRGGDDDHRRQRRRQRHLRGPWRRPHP